jgi:hypothetical protein
LTFCPADDDSPPLCRSASHLKPSSHALIISHSHCKHQGPLRWRWSRRWHPQDDGPLSLFYMKPKAWATAAPRPGGRVRDCPRSTSELWVTDDRDNYVFSFSASCYYGNNCIFLL